MSNIFSKKKISLHKSGVLLSLKSRKLVASFKKFTQKLPDRKNVIYRKIFIVFRKIINLSILLINVKRPRDYTALSPIMRKNRPPQCYAFSQLSSKFIHFPSPPLETIDLSFSLLE